MDALASHVANRLVMVGKRRFAGVPEQLIDGVDRAPDDPLD